MGNDARLSNEAINKNSTANIKNSPKPFDHPDWVFELKHDGFRGMAYVENGSCRLVSRNGNVFTRFSLLCGALGKLPVTNAILDGEIICTDEEGTSLFNQLLFRRGIQYFYAFDLLWLDDSDLRPRTLLERKNRLREIILKCNNPALLYADHIDEFGVDFFEMICQKNLEGIVAKHRGSRYDSSAKWVKIKNKEYAQSKNRHELFDNRNVRPKAGDKRER